SAGLFQASAATAGRFASVGRTTPSQGCRSGIAPISSRCTCDLRHAWGSMRVRGLLASLYAAMSELEDRPEPDQEAEGAKQGAGSGSEPKSKVESGWDALLGSASSSASRPIFAPPGAAKRAASGPVPDAVPRT